VMPAVCLSLHGRFVCRRSGPCLHVRLADSCGSDRWTAWREALAAGRLVGPGGQTRDDILFVVPPDLPPGAGAVLRTRASGACVFYRENEGLCAVQCAPRSSSASRRLPALSASLPDRGRPRRGVPLALLPHRREAGVSHPSRAGSGVAPSALVRPHRARGPRRPRGAPPLLRPGVPRRPRDLPRLGAWRWTRSASISRPSRRWHDSRRSPRN